MRVLSLFSGIGGLDLAAEWAGMTVVGQVEIDEYCQQVLARHWPRVKRVADIRQVWGYDFGTVDVIVGGFPCQPFSVAGRQRGAADDRHLWPQMRRVIQVYRPAWVVAENVPGLIRLGLDAVLADLDADGYEATAVVFPAAATGAPHLRERVFIVAHASRRGFQRRSDGEQSGATLAAIARNGGELGHSNSQRRRARGNSQQHSLARGPIHERGTGSPVPLADSCGEGLSNLNATTRRPHAKSRRVLDRQAQSRLGRATDGLSAWLDVGRRLREQRWPTGPGEAQEAWEAPRTITARIPKRASRLKALGNAVVPMQAYPIFAAIMAVEAEGENDGEEDEAALGAASAGV